jgi:hypothetical protein
MGMKSVSLRSRRAQPPPPPRGPPPKRHTSRPVRTKPAPCTVRFVPPSRGPERGYILSSVGAGTDPWGMRRSPALCPGATLSGKLRRSRTPGCHKLRDDLLPEALPTGCRTFGRSCTHEVVPRTHRTTPAHV